MTGYKIKFNGVDRLYDAFSWRLTRRAKAVWKSGDMLQGKYLKQLESEVAKKYKRKYAIGVGSATDGLYFAMQAGGVSQQSKHCLVSGIQLCGHFRSNQENRCRHSLR